jgi:hypothetical protein
MKGPPSGWGRPFLLADIATLIKGRNPVKIPEKGVKLKFINGALIVL